MPVACTHADATADSQPLPLPPLFRSEGFAEDLDDTDSGPAAPRLPAMLGRTAPRLLAWLGVALALSSTTAQAG